MSPTRYSDKLLAWDGFVDNGQLGLIEPNTIQQALKTSRLPIITGHVALMPDAHVGMGATIGSVIPTENAIIPAAVGVDIGCGMIAAKLNLTASQLPDTLDPLIPAFGRSIPAGVGKGHDDRGSIERSKLMPPPPSTVSTEHATTALAQFGSLGSGNHFVEVCLDPDDNVWVVLHSGSRGVGNKLAQGHIKLARAFEQDLEDKDLAYFIAGTPEFEHYITDMLWAQDYAAANREEMLKAAFIEITTLLGGTFPGVADKINCHHNFAALETHDGRPTWITRKGAIRAQTGDRGVIPGSMGASTFIVHGKANSDSYNSCSHGAGRTMSRSQAKRELTPGSLTARMRHSGITWNNDADALLDEHPDSYKNVDDVMAAQADLVAVETVLHQILNYKGV